MKLDNIIYDVESLQGAIAQQWAADSEIFASIYPSDTATALINGLAAYGSMLQYCLTAALANCYTTTAFSEAAVYQLADTLGNDLHGNVSAQVIVTVKKNNFIGIHTVIPAYSSFEINGKKFFNPQAIIMPTTVDELTNITLVQGEIIDVTKITSGIANEKFYFSSDFKASPNYISVSVNNEEWSIVDSFLGYDKSYVLDSTEMNVVILKTDPDGRAYVKVGDGQLATLPLSGSLLQIKYCSNDGLNGNINETGIYGSLTSQLLFVDSTGKEDILDLEVVTITTAYGGFSKQSIETLQYSSPYVFASGHRCIRRQDYNAMLQNKCGYLASAVWGEYEQANKIGTYDPIMMNMVYYTGIKNFISYPYFTIDPISNPVYYSTALHSSSGFCGSYSYRISNTIGSSEKVYLQDTGGQGLLFINDNSQDQRDSLLPEWIAAANNGYENILGEIVNGGDGYKVNDELSIDFYPTIKNINIEVVNSNINVYQGTKCYVPNGFESDGVTPKFEEYIYPSTKTSNIATAGGRYYLFPVTDPMAENLPYNIRHSGVTKTFCGPTQPIIAAEYAVWYDTSTNLIKLINDYGREIHSNCKVALPIAIENCTKTGESTYSSEIEEILNNTRNIILRVTKVDDHGTVQEVKLLTRTTIENLMPDSSDEFYTYSTKYYKQATKTSTGKNLTVSFKQQALLSPIISTNDEDEPGSGWDTTIDNARSDKLTSTYYKSSFTPSLQSPLQIKLKFSEQRAIAGIKFQAVNPNDVVDGCPFIGTMAMFGTTLPESDPNYNEYNIRNSDNWDCIINRKELISPWTENDTNDHWTDWIATNCFGIKSGNTTVYFDESKQPYFKKYTTFIIEIYSAQDIGVNNPKVAFNAMKILYGEEASTLVYDENGKTNVNFPIINSPGPGPYNYSLQFNAEGYSASNLINSLNFPLYNYQVDLSGITSENGYKDNDLLAYNFEGVNNTNILFTIQVASVINQQYIINIRNTTSLLAQGSNILVGNQEINNEITEFNPIYAYTFELDPTSEDTGYAVDDLIQVADKNNNVTDLMLRVTSIENNGKISALTWINNISLTNPPLDQVNEYTSSNTGTNGNGQGFKLKVISTPLITGSGGKIQITSNNNLQMDASFTGNRIASDQVNYFDEPIIKQYNHFTTYLEFVQPEIVQQNIRVQVAVEKNAKVTSGIILQNVRNNILKLFDITPDYIGKGIKLSDIYKAVSDTEYVSWCKVLKPTDNVKINMNDILIASDIILEEVIDSNV